MIKYLLYSIILITLTRSSTYTITQEFITQGFTDNDFTTWNPLGPSVPFMKFFTCGNNRIFGGYNIFVGHPTNPSEISKSWSLLIPHYSVTISMKLYKIDSWLNNTIFFMVDGVTVQVYTFNATNGGTTDICGNPTPVTDAINTSYNDLIVSVSFTIPHTSSNLALRIISNLASSSGSWGIRDLLITMAACDQTCLTCTSSSSCTSCDPSYSLVLSGAFCVCSNPSALRRKTVPCSAYPCTTCVSSPCGNGFYQSSATTCEPCNVACSQCVSAVNSAATCNNCNTINGYFGTPPATACFSCFSGCKTCLTGASNSCGSCFKGYFLVGSSNTCVQTCPNGSFGQQSSSLCRLCGLPCVNCVGYNGGNYYCLSCQTNKYLYDYACYAPCPYSMYGYQGVCISSCPTGTYPDVATFTCISCVANCIQCINGVSCIICSTGTYLYLNVCYVTCPATLYGSNQTQLCLSCHSSCLTCNGPFSDNCASCTGAAVLVGTICYTTCPSNTYSVICLPCHSTCLTCNGPSTTNCITCSSPYFFHLNYSQCLSTCNLGQVSDNYNFTCTKCPTKMVAYFEVCQKCSLTCLQCYGITFLQCSSCNPGTSLVKTTCVLSNDRQIIYMPYSNAHSLFSAFVTFFIIHVVVSLFLEIIFQYKTNFLQTIQLIQILSYTQFLTIQISQSTQKLAHFLYITNFSALISLNSVSPHPSLPSKFQVIGKTGYFISDAFGIQIVMLVCSVIYLFFKYFSQRYQSCMKIYKKINPYILAYTFRLILLQFSLNTMLYIYCFDASSSVGAGSLFLLLVNLILIVLSLCWRIKTEQQGTQIALFYCNQMGQSISNKQKQYITADQHVSNSLQQKIKKGKILPGIMQLLLKVPIPITILYFVGNQSTQTICFFIYFCFYLLLAIIIPIRRKIFRLNLLLNSVFLVFNAFGAILVAKGKATSYYFQGVWFTVLILLFVITVMQIISNYNFFISFFSFLKYKIRNWNEDTSKQPNNVNQSNSNLPSQEDQSVIFQKANKKNRSQAKNMKKYLEQKNSNLSEVSDG